MTGDEIRRTVVDVLQRIAPEIDPAAVDPGLRLRDQLDLDSMGVLNFVLALHDRFGLDIPEADYPRLSTLDGVVAYVAASRRSQGAS